MAGICCGVTVGESEAAAPVEPSSRGSVRRMLEPLQFKLVADAAAAAAAVSVKSPPLENGRKRRKIGVPPPSRERSIPAEVGELAQTKADEIGFVEEGNEVLSSNQQLNQGGISKEPVEQQPPTQEHPKFGLTSVCGRRRDMEDAVSVKPWLCSESQATGLHLFGVFDGHGCSHVAMRCKHRLHEIVEEEIQGSTEEQVQWKETMEKSFARMDREVDEWTGGGVRASNCRCELQTPQCDAVGSTAVVAVVTPDKIIVSNCGDSRAVLCRNGVAVPLSSDHKPDRPDELLRIQDAGGRVIYWDGPRVLGVLAMSRAIGDNYLKPYVIPDPEVTVIDRTAHDECLILASDGLWDVVSNETACGVARMCLRSQNPPPSPARSPGSAEVALAAVGGAVAESSDKACTDASILLTKLALARRSSDNVSVVVVDLRRDGAEQR